MRPRCNAESVRALSLLPFVLSVSVLSVFVLSIFVAFVFQLPAQAKDFTKPQANPAQSYPAHDDHAADHVAIAADPYDTHDKAKIFSINFAEHGFLPVFFVVSNDGAQPISLANMRVTLTTHNRDKITPADPDDLFRRLTNPRANDHPLPIPIPQKKVKGGLSQKDRDEILTSQFAAKAVEPHATQSGFLFFDIAGIDEPSVGAHIYVEGVNNAQGTELLYFEIPMGK